MKAVREAFPEFEKPTVAIDSVIMRCKDIDKASLVHVSSKQMQVLLVRKKSDDSWHLPGTIMRLGESPKDSLDRVMNYKIHTDIVNFEQLYTVADDPARDERGHIITIIYIGKYRSMEMAMAQESDEYTSEWFWITKEKDGTGRSFVSESTGQVVSDLKYDHKQIICDTIQRIQGKLMYTGIGFDFIDEKFTLAELENTFKAIAERNIPGFRRVIKDKVVGTGEKYSVGACRPAEIFIKKE